MFTVSDVRIGLYIHAVSGKVGIAVVFVVTDIIKSQLEQLDEQEHRILKTIPISMSSAGTLRNALGELQGDNVERQSLELVLELGRNHKGKDVLQNNHHCRECRAENNVS